MKDFVKLKSPIFIFLAGLIELPLLLIFPVSPAYELAFAFVPLFFGLIGVLFAIVYWGFKKIFRREFEVLYYFLLFGLVFSELLTALSMAYP